MFRNRTRTTGDDDGFSLIEVIVAMSIFAMVAMAATSGFIAQIALDGSNRGRTVAASIAASELDAVQAMPVENLVTVPPRDTVVGGRTFHVSRDVTEVSLGSTNGACQGGADNGGSLTVMRVTVFVSWDNMGATKPIRADTQITPKALATSDQYNIGIRVVDATNSPVAAQMVNLSGPAPRAVTTTADGCAFFSRLPGGTYTATASRAGWVDSQGAATARIAVTVPSGTGVTTTVDLQYSPSASLILAMPGTDAFPLAANAPVTIANSSLLPASRMIPGTGQTRSIDSLFPYAAGYDTWLGGCADADPEGINAGNGVRYWPDASRTAPLIAQTTAPTAGTVEGAALQIQFQRSDGSVATGIQVTALHASDGLCPAGESYPLTQANGNGNANGSGNANGNGTGNGNVGPVHATLPYGTWTLQFSGAAVGSNVVLLAPGNRTTVVTVNVQ